MKRELILAEHQGQQSLRATAPLVGLLATPQAREVAGRFGSELSHTRGESVADIDPPIPKDRIAAFGAAMLELVERFEPGSETQFRTTPAVKQEEAKLSEDFDDSL